MAMPSNDDKNRDPQGSDARRKAHALMEQALALLDTAEEDLVAAKLDDAIYALGLRDEDGS